VNIDSKTDLVLIEIINTVEVLQKGITYQEKISIFAWQLALVYDEIAFSFVGLIEILFWVYFENVVAHLEPNWLNLWSNFFTGFLNIAEGLIGFTIQLWESSLPLLSYFLKNIWWDGQLRAAGVNDGWIAGLLSWLLDCRGSIGHSLSFESPGS
jgi:hypothetical protein